MNRGTRGQQRAKAKAPAGTSGQAQDGHRINGGQPRQSGTGAAAGNKGKGKGTSGHQRAPAGTSGQAPDGHRINGGQPQQSGTRAAAGKGKGRDTVAIVVHMRDL